MQKKHFKILTYFVLACSTLVALTFTLKCSLITYDGAIFVQAAKNLFDSYQLELNNGDKVQVQVNIVFQIINGLLLKLFGDHPFSFQTANILFYLLFLALLIALSRKLGSLLLLLIASFLSTSSTFLSFAFNGYGELPAFCLIFISILLFTYSQGNTKQIAFLSGVIFGLAVGIKWLSLITLPAFFFLSLLTREFRKFFYYFFASLIIIFTSLVLKYWDDPGQLSRFVTSLFAHQTNPYANDLYFLKGDLLSKTIEHLQLFSSLYFYELGPIPGTLKIVLFLIFSFTFFKLVIKKEKLNNVERIFICLYVIILVNLIWYFFFSSRFWYRRYFFADMSLFIAAGLLPNLILFKHSLKTYYIKILSAIFAGLIIASLYLRISTIVDKDQCAVQDTWKQLQNAIEFKEGDKLFAVGRWQSPVWSLALERKIDDILISNVFYEDLEEENKYLLIEDKVFFDEIFTKIIINTYELKSIFKHQGYEIFKILDFKKTDQSEGGVRYISFDQYIKNTRIYRSPLIAKYEQVVYFDNTNSRIALKYSAPECFHEKTLKIILKTENQRYEKITQIQTGTNSLVLDNIPLGNVKMYVLVQQEKDDFKSCSLYDIEEGISIHVNNSLELN